MAWLALVVVSQTTVSMTISEPAVLRVRTTMSLADFLPCDIQVSIFLISTFFFFVIDNNACGRILIHNSAFDTKPKEGIMPWITGGKVGMKGESPWQVQHSLVLTSKIIKMISQIEGGKTREAAYAMIFALQYFIAFVGLPHPFLTTGYDTQHNGDIALWWSFNRLDLGPHCCTLSARL